MSGVNDLERNKWSYEQLFAYFEEIATKSKHINGFTRVDVMNLNREKHSGLSTPFLGLEDPGIAPKNDNADDIEWEWSGAFIICTEVARDDETGYREAMSKAGMVMQKILAWMLNDRLLGHIIDFRFSSTKALPVKQVFRNCVGYRMTFKMPSQFDMNMYDADWNDYRKGFAVPPFATVEDGTLIKKLSAGDYHVCSTTPALDALAILKNTAGKELSQTAIASGVSEEIIAPNGSVKLIDTAIGYLDEVEVESGGNTHLTAPDGNVSAQNSAGVSLGSTPVLSGGNAVINVPDVTHIQTDGSEVELPAGVGLVCDAGASSLLDVEVYSDAGYTTPITTTTYNQKVYIRATPTNTSPTGYIFFAFDGVNIHPIGQQVGNEISGEVPFIGSYQIYANTLGSDTVYGSETMTGSSDPNALLYINAHNTASSLTMADSQQLVINETYARFKGARTTNNSNLWAKLSTSNAEIYPFAPVSNSVTSLPTIAVDMVNPSTLATIVNFLSTDVEVDGVTANSTKWLVLKNQPSDFGQDDVGADVYYKTSSTSVGMYVGAYNGNMSNGVFFSPQYCGANNTYANSNLPRAIGLLSINRDNAADFQLYNRGVEINSITRASTVPPSLPFFGFATNRDGSPDTGFGRKFSGKLAMVANRCSFTDEELADWNEIWEYYTANIIL